MADWHKFDPDCPPRGIVFVAYRNCAGMSRVVRAKYYRHHEEEIDRDILENWVVYDEDTDMCYLQEGWWEVVDNDHEAGLYQIEDEISHWANIRHPENG